MKINQNNISELIIKLLQAKLHDEDEKQQLDDWIASDSKHNQFIDELKLFANVEDDLKQIAQFDENIAWEELVKIRRKRKSRQFLKQFYRVAGILIGVFAVSAITYQLFWRQPSNQSTDRIIADKSGIYTNDILPADTSAQLILADGSVISVGNADMKIQDGAIHMEGEESPVLKEDISDEPPVLHTLSVPKAAFYKLILPDGSKVWLNAMSQLHFPAQFPKNERHVVLEGEGYFEIAKDSERPFIVEASGTSIKVLGTHFNINSYRGRTRTTLLEGSVEVRKGKEVVKIIPGEEAAVSSSGINISKVDVSKVTAWKDGEFYFKGDNIATIVSQLGRWYDLDIRFSRTVDTKKHYSGKISRKSTLAEVLAMLTHVSDLRFEVLGKQLVVH